MNAHTVHSAMGPRHTMDAVAMVELLAQPVARGEEGHTCTIDVASFIEVFGQANAPERRSKRRETVDPSKLRELLQKCVVEDDEDNETVSPQFFFRDSNRRRRMLESGACLLPRGRGGASPATRDF